MIIDILTAPKKVPLFILLGLLCFFLADAGSQQPSGQGWAILLAVVGAILLLGAAIGTMVFVVESAMKMPWLPRWFTILTRLMGTVRGWFQRGVGVPQQGD